MKENRLWYTAPASVWEEALPLGNGILGMMVFGGIAEDRIQLNEETMWSGWPENNDSEETYPHLDEMRRLIFEGRYTEAQKQCEKYMICAGEGSHDWQGGYGSYQTAGDLYLTTPFTSDEGYRRELFLDRGYARVSFNGCIREYISSYAYNTAVIRVTGGEKERLSVTNAKTPRSRPRGIPSSSPASSRSPMRWSSAPCARKAA